MILSSESVIDLKNWATKINPGQHSTLNLFQYLVYYLYLNVQSHIIKLIQLGNMMTYRLNDLKETFETYALKCGGNFLSGEQIEVHGEYHTVAWLMQQLSNCTHTLPEALCDFLKYEHGTTYAGAVNFITSESNNKK